MAKRISVDKQEDVVIALYEFAHDLETMEHNCTSINPETKVKTTVNLSAVGTTLEKIMATFGYQVVEIQ
jgi:hypothetical protein